MEENRKPGRPKKKPEMTETKSVEMTSLALGMYQDLVDRQWYIATLKFDPVSGLATVTDRTLAGEDKYFANEAFKIKTIELEIL